MTLVLFFSLIFNHLCVVEVRTTAVTGASNIISIYSHLSFIVPLEEMVHVIHRGLLYERTELKREAFIFPF